MLESSTASGWLLPVLLSADASLPASPIAEPFASATTDTEEEAMSPLGATLSVSFVLVKLSSTVKCAPLTPERGWVGVSLSAEASGWSTASTEGMPSSVAVL